MVYHPYWGPRCSFNRRWVYFPGHNMYWDNWRNHYVFFYRGAWVSQPALPPGVRKKDLQNERHRELSERDDDLDDVYRNNGEHQSEMKSDFR
jgi:hypothetical protein